MALTELFVADRATTTVSSGGTDAPVSGTSETWLVASSSMFGAASTGVSQFHIADPAAPIEIIAVTNVTGTTWTVTRGAESTVPVTHITGFTIYQVLTTGFLASPVFSGAVSTGGLTGATAASRYAGATTSGAPASGTFITGDWVIDQTGKIWICTTGGTPGTWAQAGSTIPLTTLGDTLYENATPALARLPGNTSGTKNFLTQTGTGSASAAPAWGTIAAGDLPAATTSTQGAVIIDGTASDIQPSPGTGTAGAKGQAADSEHVHPWKPWQFHVAVYGAKGNGVMVTDAVMSSSSATLACTTSTPFTSGSVGNAVCVIGAGTSSSPGSAAGRPLVTTISGYTNSGHVTLTASASNAVSGTGAVFGTDDTAAVQAAIAAAFTYAQVHGYAEILFDPVYYIIAGAPVVGGGTLGNSQLTLPVYSEASTTKKITLAFTGAHDSAPCLQFLDTSMTPFAPGTVLCSLTAPATLDGTYGPACVLGGPWAGYGGGGGTFSNMQVDINGITIQPVFVSHDPGVGNTSNSTGPVIGGINLYGIGAAWVKNYTFLPLAVSASASTTWPYWANPDNWSGTQWQPALFMPDAGNNDGADIDRFTCYGAWAGIIGSEHCTWDVARILFTGRAVIAFNPSGGSNTHGLSGRYLSVESCGYIIDVEHTGTYASSGAIGVQVLQCDTESVVDNWIYDPGANLFGGMNIQDNAGVGYRSSKFDGSPATINFRAVMSGNAPGPVTAATTAPATTVAWPNYFYRDAWMTAALSGGHTFTTLAIDGTAQPNAAGASTYQFILPSGHSYTPAYTAGTLTQTVTLL